ncbi:hypothetical protein EDC01DRAFT_39675 [Geopyxis carbonaria]|nr:hypothetical protein EDC01DRAFT_39675 [Geopyxis carbonaria]
MHLVILLIQNRVTAVTGSWDNHCWDWLFLQHLILGSIIHQSCMEVAGTVNEHSLAILKPIEWWSEEGEQGGLALLTPPDDNGVLDWRHDNNVRGIIADESTTVRMIAGKLEQQPPANTSTENVERVKVNPNGTGEGSDDTKRPKELLANTSTSSTSSTPKLTTSGENQNAPTGEDWIESAMDVLVTMSTEAVRILSYTLPCPLPDAPNADDPNRSNPINPDRLPASAASAPSVAAAAGQQLSPKIAAKCNLIDGKPPGWDGGMTTALHTLTTAIQRRYLTEGSRKVYIHVSHAIDPQIPLSRLPTTPPLTGGGASAGGFGSPGFEGGDMGYFSPTVFNSIVVAPSSMVSTPIVGTPIQSHPPLALPSPNPILPPNSLHLTLLERYIPPTTIAEDAAMFNVKKSIIIDRLFELSPNGGSLLFIYPTKTGAINFDREYLGQVLDPLLRKLMVLYALREELLWKIRSMDSTSHMAEYPVLKDRIEKFCDALSNGESDLPRTPTKLVYSAKVSVSLNEFSWREWWTTQEQMRIREAVKNHLSSGQAAPAAKGKARTAKGKETEAKSGYWQGYGVPGDLAREVLDGVRAPSVRPSSRGMGEAVLASSMSGSGSGGGGGIAGVGGASGEVPRTVYAKQRKGVEVGVFVLRRGLDP